MTCSFLESFSLAKLIAPVTEGEFRQRYWEQMPLLVGRNNPQFYEDLFSLQDFDREVAGGPSYVKIAEASKKMSVRREGKTTTGLEALLADMRDGSTLVMDALNEREPKLRLLCRLLAQELSYRFQTNLYLTPPKGQGFTPHWDNHDVFILQVHGSKNWKIEKQRRTFPARSENMSNADEERIMAPESDAFTLHQGDLIYIPRGFVHAAECGEVSSLHITLGIHPETWSGLLHATINAFATGDRNLHRALPIGFLHGKRSELVSGLIAALQRVANENYLGAVVDQFCDEVPATFTLDVQGQVAEFMQPAPLTLGHKIGPRPGIVYTMHVESEAVRINYGGRKILFPDFLANPLEFTLNTPEYAIREIAGDLEDSEKLVFIERLLQEGLVVRK